MTTPGVQLLHSYKRGILTSLVGNQDFWKATKEPDTDLYAIHTDDAFRTNIMKQVVALPKLNEVDLRLALSSSWDATEMAANFNAYAL